MSISSSCAIASSYGETEFVVGGSGGNGGGGSCEGCNDGKEVLRCCPGACRRGKLRCTYGVGRVAFVRVMLNGKHVFFD